MARPLQAIYTTFNWATMPDDPIDPVCGMTVMPESSEGKAEFQGRTYYFCSDQCMRPFQSDPAKYAK